MLFSAGQQGTVTMMISSLLTMRLPQPPQLGKLPEWVLPLRPLRGLQEPRVATREESGVLGFPSRRGLTPRRSLECNPEIPAFPGEE